MSRKLLLWLFLLFWIGDAFLLNALPWLGLSFGAPGLTLTAALFARGGLALLLAALAPRLRGEWQRRAAGWAWLGLNGAATLLAVYGLYFEPFNLQTGTMPLAAPDFLPHRPLRLLYLSDLHIERLTRREEDILQTARALQPDLILLGGDYLNLDYLDDPLALAETRAFLGQLAAPYGVFAVNGSVDSPATIARLFDGLAITVLEDEAARVTFPGGDLLLVGVNNWGLSRDRAALETLAQGWDAGDYVLLLYHTPDLIETAAQTGVDVYLAGHTHGGQVRLPFYGALVTFSAYGKQFESGRYTVGATTLYVSRGLGMEGFGMPRVRILCPPEVVLVSLSRELAGEGAPGADE